MHPLRALCFSVLSLAEMFMMIKLLTLHNDVLGGADTCPIEEPFFLDIAMQFLELV